jgi:hypothetical protein
MATTTTLSPVTGPIDCACVIHGTGYDWIYVERLYNMLSRHITPGIRLHVYTETNRPVPAPMIKHELTEWFIGGPKKSWWYKMQMFNPAHHAGPLLYFDLDVVIVNNIDWIWQQSLRHFWTVRDFKYLWRPTHYGINSSIMWWDTQKFQHIWEDFNSQDLNKIVGVYRGDQDYITEKIADRERRFLDATQIKSWRWQCLDGGYDFKRKLYFKPGAGTVLANTTDVLIFHGQPKPGELQDSVVVHHWR